MRDVCVGGTVALPSLSCTAVTWPETLGGVDRLWEASAVGGALALLWAAAVLALWLAARRHVDRVGDPGALRAAIRLVPDVVRLLRRLAADPALPRGVRLRVVGLLVYLALPFDLVPDMIPVLGYADDVLVVLWTVRSVVRGAGEDALDRHWPGTPEALVAVKRLAGVRCDPR